MSSKRLPLVTREYYHLYNKSIADERIFANLENLAKILEITDYYRFNQRIRLSKFFELPKTAQQIYIKEIQKTTPIIDIYSFSFMPNHFHFVVKQLQNDGILKFVSNIQNSYAKYFDLKNNREGSLFLSSFKYKRIIKEEQFFHVCRYVHLNPVTSYIIDFKQLTNYPYNSYSCYLNSSLNRFVNRELIMNFFKTNDRFVKFHQNQVDYQRKLKEIEKLLLD